MAQPIKRKLVIVGDGACGKTSLVTVFCCGEFPREYEPTIFEVIALPTAADGARLADLLSPAPELCSRTEIGWEGSAVGIVGYCVSIFVARWLGWSGGAQAREREGNCASDVAFRLLAGSEGAARAVVFRIQI